MVRKGKNKRTSEQELRTTNEVLGSVTTLSLPGGRRFAADLLSTTGPLSTVPRFSTEGLDHIANQDLLHDEFFKRLRSSHLYQNQWEYISSLPDLGSPEWKMIALSFCAQVAIETTKIYPWLEPQAHKWLRGKFIEQGVPCDFETRWEAYSDYCRSDLELIEGRIYLNVAGCIQFRWFGDPPDGKPSSKYRITQDERDR